MIYVCPNRNKHQDDIPMEVKDVFVTHPINGNWIVNIMVTYKCPKCGRSFVKMLAYDAKKEALV